MNIFDWKQHFHPHEWSVWEHTNQHSWSHAVTMYRTCKTCFVDEYKLIELNCPQYKIKGEYCNWCERYAEEWGKRLAKMEIAIDKNVSTPYNEDNTMAKFKTGPKDNTELKKRNQALYDFIKAGHTYAEAQNRFDITRARSYQIVQQIEKKLQKQSV